MRSIGVLSFLIVLLAGSCVNAYKFTQRKFNYKIHENPKFKLAKNKDVLNIYRKKLHQELVKDQDLTTTNKEYFRNKIKGITQSKI